MLFFLFLTVISQCTSNEINSIPDDFSQFNETNNNQKEKCVCYNIIGETVTDKIISLSPGSPTIERLVVYIYRETATNKMYIYIPKKEKQYSLPEFSLDVDDDLAPTGSETITQIVTDKDAKPIVTIHKPYTDYHEDDHDSQPIYDGEINDYQEETDTNYDMNTNPNKPDIHYLPIKPSDQNLSKNDEQDENDNTDFDNQNFPEPFFPSTNQDNPSEAQIFVTNLDIPDNIINDNAPAEIHQEEQQVLYLDSDLKPAEVTITEIDEEIDLPNSESDIYAQPDIFIADDHNSENEITNNIHILPRPVGKYVNFDKWFDQQMYRINKTRQRPNKNIDFPSLKLLIEKALYDNHMYITNDGVLIDSYGNALNVANIKLRPILIGNAVPYNILLNVKDNKVELPSDVPYLEAVLVTLMYPPKVLGVIPLGKTYVPRISYRRGFNFWPHNRLSSSCASGKCSIRNPLFVVRKGASHRTRMHPRYHSNAPKLMRSQPKHLRRKPIKKQEKLDVLQALNSLFSFDLKSPKRPKLKSSMINYFSDTDALDEYLSKVNNDYEIPGFRIIGGSAATGSGTPVSSRGRSGMLLDK